MLWLALPNSPSPVPPSCNGEGCVRARVPNLGWARALQAQQTRSDFKVHQLHFHACCLANALPNAMRAMVPTSTAARMKLALRSANSMLMFQRHAQSLFTHHTGLHFCACVAV